MPLDKPCKGLRDELGILEGENEPWFFSSFASLALSDYAGPCLGEKNVRTKAAEH